MENDMEEILTRDEYIRLARQSCVKNLQEKYQEGGKRNNKVSLVKKDYSDDFFGYNMETADKTEMILGPVSKRLLLRIICISTIFLFVIALDWFDLSYDKMNSASIEKMITGNDYVDSAQDYVVNLYEKYISSDNSEKE